MSYPELNLDAVGAVDSVDVTSEFSILRRKIWDLVFSWAERVMAILWEIEIESFDESNWIYSQYTASWKRVWIGVWTLEGNKYLFAWNEVLCQIESYETGKSWIICTFKAFDWGSYNLNSDLSISEA